MISPKSNASQVPTTVNRFDLELVARARDQLPQLSDAEHLAVVFDALSDVTRLKIAITLHRGGEACVSDICHVVGMSLSGVSQHLRRLRDAAIVRRRRAGKRTYYSLQDGPVGEVLTRMLESCPR